jgi:hypothetical protein
MILCNQPTASQKKEMASTWTEELTIETLRHAAQAFASIPDFAQSLQTLADEMMAGFQTLLHAGQCITWVH